VTSHGLSIYDILGVDVVSAAGRDVIEAIDTATGRGEFVRLAYLNAHASNLSASNPSFAAALRQCWVLNDGVGVDIAARLLHGAKFPENLNGTDFTVRFLQETSRTWNVFLLGARPGVAERAAAAIINAAPRHRIAGVQHGYYAPEDTSRVLGLIKASGADLILVAFGNPKQELWIVEHAVESGARLLMGVGALFDFLSGEAARAPGWVRGLRAEWIYRLVREPRRLGWRYVVGNPLFLARTLRRRFFG
jgi:exopolysaccharide biosynthesis WecB/TagA/CpsF family protein